MGSETNSLQLLTRKRGRPTLPSMTDFGAFIRERRKALGLTQAGLAEKAGLSPGAISLIETGERSELQALTARRLSKALNLTSDELIDRMEPVSS